MEQERRRLTELEVIFGEPTGEAWNKGIKLTNLDVWKLDCKTVGFFPQNQ